MYYLEKKTITPNTEVSRKMDRIRVLIVDDQAIVRKSIHMFLDTDPTIQVIGEAIDVQDAIRQARSLLPAVVLMDLILAQGNSCQAITEIKSYLPSIKIIVLTMSEDKTSVEAALAAGADGYLHKGTVDGEALLQAIHATQ